MGRGSGQWQFLWIAILSRLVEFWWELEGRRQGRLCCWSPSALWLIFIASIYSVLMWLLYVRRAEMHACCRCQRLTVSLVSRGLRERRCCLYTVSEVNDGLVLEWDDLRFCCVKVLCWSRCWCLIHVWRHVACSAQSTWRCDSAAVRLIGRIISLVCPSVSCMWVLTRKQQSVEKPKLTSAFLRPWVTGLAIKWRFWVSNFAFLTKN